MISAKNISKHFGTFQALSNVSFEIQESEIVGLLGKNGAGKTTLMRILTSFLPASSGSVLIDGEDVSKNSLATRENIGYLPETPPLYLNMTVKDYLQFSAEIKSIPARKRRPQLERVLAECQLEQVTGKTIGTLSKGYKQRVGIAQAIIHDPKLLILDEPTSGLDPIQNLQVRKLINSLKDRRTVIVSTHILSEIEHIAQRVLMIKSGQIIVDEPLDVLMRSHNSAESRACSLEDIFIQLHEEPDYKQQCEAVNLNG